MPGRSTVTMTYDGVDRMLRVVGSAELTHQKTTAYDQQLTFGLTHNILSKQRIHTITENSGSTSTPPHTNFSSDYIYGARPHLPLQIGTMAIEYDPTGNPIKRRKIDTGSVQTMVWDDDNRLAAFVGANVNQRNTYDYSGQRVRRKSIQSETIFASPYFDLENGVQGVSHIFAGATRIASNMSKFSSSTPVAPPSKPGTPYFFHQDHLGSTTVLTNAEGHESIEYFSDGEMWLDRGPLKPVTGYLFSGKAFDPDTGFYDFGQRFYEPRTSLWMTQDPKLRADPVATIGRPALLNALAYVDNSPLMFVDPDGLDKEKAARLLVVDVDNALRKQEEAAVKAALSTALADVTTNAADQRLSKGVRVGFFGKVNRLDNFRARKDIIVYAIRETDDLEAREKVVAKILAAENVKKDRIRAWSQTLAGNLSDQNLHHDAFDISIVNVPQGDKDLTEEQVLGVAGDIIHEGIGHRALDDTLGNGQDPYHSKGGVMSKRSPRHPKPEDLLFSKDEREKVKEFLQKLIDSQ